MNPDMAVCLTCLCNKSMSWRVYTAAVVQVSPDKHNGNYLLAGIFLSYFCVDLIQKGDQ